MTQRDLELLDRYVALNDPTYCRPVCDACATSCPAEVPISDVLRHKMYFEDYGAERMAMERYAKLSINAAACTTCADQACMSACTYGLPIPELTRRAHAELQWNAGS